MLPQNTTEPGFHCESLDSLSMSSSNSFERQCFTKSMIVHGKYSRECFNLTILYPLQYCMYVCVCVCRTQNNICQFPSSTVTGMDKLQNTRSEMCPDVLTTITQHIEHNAVFLLKGTAMYCSK